MTIKIDKKTKVSGSKGFAIKEIGIKKDGSLFVSIPAPPSARINKWLDLQCHFRYTDKHTVLIDWVSVTSAEPSTGVDAK